MKVTRASGGSSKTQKRRNLLRLAEVAAVLGAAAALVKATAELVSSLAG
jgi:hypothetical protein